MGFPAFFWGQQNKNLSTFFWREVKELKLLFRSVSTGHLRYFPSPESSLVQCCNLTADGGARGPVVEGGNVLSLIYIFCVHHSAQLPCASLVQRRLGKAEASVPGKHRASWAAQQVMDLGAREMQMSDNTFHLCLLGLSFLICAMGTLTLYRTVFRRRRMSQMTSCSHFTCRPEQRLQLLPFLQKRYLDLICFFAPPKKNARKPIYLYIRVQKISIIDSVIFSFNFLKPQTINILKGLYFLSPLSLRMSLLHSTYKIMPLGLNDFRLSYIDEFITWPLQFVFCLVQF